MTKDQWTSEDQAAATQKAWEDELLRRYQNGVYLTKADAKEARKILKARKPS